LPLRQRVLFAQKRRAALFVSLHANYSPSPRPHGIAVYRFAYRSSDLSSALVANWENAAGLVGDAPLAHRSSTVDHILSSLIRHETWDHSALLQSTMVEGLAMRVGMLPDPGRHAHFAVLRAADIPSVLIELGFLSNPVDERHLASPHSRRLLARALVQAIDLYFHKLRERRLIHG
jgi:N-acetylmuramoyl-L-alanine amidase